MVAAGRNGRVTVLALAGLGGFGCGIKRTNIQTDKHSDYLYCFSSDYLCCLLLVQVSTLYQHDIGVCQGSNNIESGRTKR